MGTWGCADQDSHWEKLARDTCSLMAFSGKKGFVSKALASEDLNESLDPAMSIVTPWTSAGSSLKRECPRAWLLKLQDEYKSPGDPLKMQILIQWVWGEGLRS